METRGSAPMERANRNGTCNVCIILGVDRSVMLTVSMSVLLLFYTTWCEG